MLNVSALPAKNKKSRTRRTYSTEFKLRYALNLASYDEVQDISRRSKANFKKYDFKKVFGLSYSSERIETLKQINDAKILYKFNKAVLLIKNAIINIYSTFMPDLKKLLKSDRIKKKIISVVNRTKDIIGLDRVCRYFNISKNSFYNWSKIKKCSDSIFNRCFNRHPNQLALKEVNKIKDILSNPITKFWPLVSSYYYGLRNNIISFRLRTFYKYAKKLGFSKSMPHNRRKKHKTGIRTFKPNKLWHADLTIFKTIDNVKVYIYIIMDNFSRKILSYRASLRYSADICLECLKEAYQKFIMPLLDKPDVKLMVDDGSEINNDKVDEFINQDFISIEKIIAQQDISFSNSMIEAVNKILKYRYIFKTEIIDFNSCVKYLDLFIPDYNNRYHCSLDGLSPNEAFTGITLDKALIKHIIHEAKAQRIAFNNLYHCPTH